MLKKCETHCTHMQFPFKESVAYRHEDLSPCCIGTYNFKTRLLQWFIYCFVSQGQEKAGVHSKSCSTFSFFYWTQITCHALLTELHWLPLPCRIDFKICLIVFKIVNNCAPQYLINMLTLYKPVRNLRSSHDQTQLVVPRFNLSLSGQCFSIYAPSVAVFKNQLKAHFFCKL